MGFGNSEQNFGMIAPQFTMAMWYTHRFAHSKYANRVILCLYYIESELFAVFIKILFDNWRHVFRPSVIHVPVKCPRSGGIWSPEWTLVWGIWLAFWLG